MRDERIRDWWGGLVAAAGAARATATTSAALLLRGIGLGHGEAATLERIDEVDLSAARGSAGSAQRQSGKIDKVARATLAVPVVHPR